MKTIKFSQFNRVLALTAVAFFSFTFLANASGVIKGQVTDENNQPVEYATAVLKNSKTNQFVTGAVCNYKGEFVIEDVNPGEYVLSTKMMGYEKKDSKVVVDKSRKRVVEEKVVMNEAPQKSIVVVGKKTATTSYLQTAGL